jgi:GNAT superfamily N-acetyltransferase
MLTVIKITDSKKYVTEGIELGIQAVMERGLNGVDFDKTDFYDKCRMLFVSPAVHKWALVRDEQLVGFILGSVTQTLWQKQPFIDVLVCHIRPEYRSVEAFQALLNAVYNFAKQENIMEIKLASDLFLLGKDNMSFLLKNGFTQKAEIWEKTFDY